MEIIVSKNCGRIVFFRGLLECLLISEGDETGKHIFDLCFPIGLADTGQPPREPEVEEVSGRAGQAGDRHRGWPAGCFAKSAKRRKEEMKGSTHLPAIRCDFCRSQKPDELVKNGNCSYPVGEKVAERGELLPLARTAT